MPVERYRLIVTLSVIVLLTACGFHLRGASTIDDRFNPIFVEQNQLQAGQLSQLIKLLKRSGAKLTDDLPTSRRLRVELSPLKKRRIARSSLNDIEILLLSMSIQYSLRANTGEYMKPAHELVESQEVELDSANLLAYDRIIQQVEQGLQRKLIQNMIIELSQ